MALHTNDMHPYYDKIKQSATEAPALLFSAKNDPVFGLMDYVASVERHFVQHGLDTIFYFKKDNVWINILTGHPQFSHEDIQTQCCNLFNNCNNASLLLPQERYDIFDANLNLPWSAAYILNSVSPEPSCSPRVEKTITRVQLFG